MEKLKQIVRRTNLEIRRDQQIKIAQLQNEIDELRKENQLLRGKVQSFSTSGSSLVSGLQNKLKLPIGGVSPKE